MYHSSREPERHWEYGLDTSVLPKCSGRLLAMALSAVIHWPIGKIRKAHAHILYVLSGLAPGLCHFLLLAVVDWHNFGKAERDLYPFPLRYLLEFASLYYRVSLFDTVTLSCIMFLHARSSDQRNVLDV